MACMKCGKTTEDAQLFCARCLETMEAYPVKPDVHIQLPVRTAEVSPKKQTRKGRPVQKDAKIARLTRQIRWLWVVIIALLLVLALSLGSDVVIPDKGETGKNYTYIDPTA